MKIGIITFWTSKDNYGQILQCWALQQYLKKMGHNPYLIRYDYTPVPVILWYKRVLKILLVYPVIKKLLKLSRRKEEKTKLLELSKKNEQRKFDDFKSENLNVSSHVYYNLKQLRDNPPDADCYMTGSDQTWAQMVDIKDNWAYFLAFGREDIPRIAYAPSFARDIYPKKLIPQLGELLSKYKAISVREKSGVGICKQAGYKAEHVLDPTFLLSKEDYINLLGLKHNPSHKIFLYSMNVEKPNEIQWDKLKSFSNAHNKEIVCTVGSGLCPGFEIYGDSIQYKYPTIKEWIEEIWNPDLVVTTSFHGIVFSIIMGTPFVYVPLKGIRGKGNSRIIEILQDMGMEERMLCLEGYGKTMMISIDWKRAKQKLSLLVENSKNFLINETALVH